MASAPALQWVSTRASAGTTAAPWRPSARQPATSSSWMRAASASMASRISSTDRPARIAAANVRFIRAMAQNRLTAVGRVAASRSQAR